jgi:ubiquinone/menaquinone biosynthesis C-methylase UbiE
MGELTKEKTMTTKTNTQSETRFLDMQADVGVTKHIGGFDATNELLSLCHIEDAREVLNVGCGIGVGSTYIAKKYGCDVVGVDISEKMIDWSRRRAKEEGVEDKVAIYMADVLDLPFEADRFDIVFAESVLIFVEDKAQAIRECVRVTKPGGYVGLNEGFWSEQPPPELFAQWMDATGPYVPTLATWQSLWEASRLHERVIRTYQVEAGTEIRRRIEWIGWWWLLRAWGRGLRLSIANPAIRRSIKGQFSVPTEVFRFLGYGLFVGKK